MAGSTGAQVSNALFDQIVASLLLHAMWDLLAGTVVRERKYACMRRGLNSGSYKRFNTLQEEGIGSIFCLNRIDIVAGLTTHASMLASARPIVQSLFSQFGTHTLDF
jgi:hypothetical protein